ncbi:MAG: CoA transferase [Chloroflexi bacterium]|nr:CoA transferase [Chloroflexota bacterium]
MGFPLAGIRVLAMEAAVAGPFATRHLADLGADVIKVERPEGDFARRYDSAVKGLSSYFVWLNRNKRSVVLEWTKERDRSALDLLLERSDVLVHNLGPGAMERLGLGSAELSAKYPRLIHAGISGYGSGGPYETKKSFDLLVQGESGVIALTGTPEQPCKVGISIADLTAGMYTFNAILAALYEREKTGKGAAIEISMLECMAEFSGGQIYTYAYSGVQLERAGWRHNIIVPYGPYRCGGGKYVNLAVQNEGQWERLCTTVLGKPELARDPLYATNALRLKNRTTLEPLIEEILGELQEAEVLKRLERADVPYGRLNDLKAVVDHPQLEARDRWADYDTEAGAVRMLHHPMNISGLPRRTDPVPSVGQHTEEVLSEIGLA